MQEYQVFKFIENLLYKLSKLFLSGFQRVINLTNEKLSEHFKCIIYLFTHRQLVKSHCYSLQHPALILRGTNRLQHPFLFSSEQPFRKKKVNVSIMPNLLATPHMCVHKFGENIFICQ